MAVDSAMTLESIVTYPCNSASEVTEDEHLASHDHLSVADLQGMPGMSWHTLRSSRDTTY